MLLVLCKLHLHGWKEQDHNGRLDSRLARVGAAGRAYRPGPGADHEELLAKQYDESVVEWGAPSPEGRRQFVEEVLSGRPTAVGEEQAFLDKIGVIADALVYGFLPHQFEGYFVNASGGIDGWTFSIEDMASFGIGNVTYAGDGDYPSERAKKEYGVIVFNVP